MQRYKVRIFKIEKDRTEHPAAYADVENFLRHGQDAGYRLFEMNTVEMGNYLAVTVVLEYQV